MSRFIRHCSILAIAALVVAASNSPGWAQRGRGGGFFPGGGGAMGMLMREDVRKELEIVDEQLEKLRAMGEEMRDEMRDMFSGLRELSDEERREKWAELRETMGKKREEMEKKVDEVLLPHQRDRLKQIVLQSQLRRSGTTGTLTEGRLAEELNVTDEQKEKLKTLEEEVRADLEKRIQEARDQARNKLLDVLTPEQRKKYEELIGKDFDVGRGGFGGFQGRSFRGRRGDGDRSDTQSET